MRLVTWDEYRDFIKTHKYVRIERAVIPIGKPHSIRKYQPGDFTLETGTVWSFPERGDWATHRGNYRGNWAPQIPRISYSDIQGLGSGFWIRCAEAELH